MKIGTIITQVSGFIHHAHCSVLMRYIPTLLCLFLLGSCSEDKGLDNQALKLSCNEITTGANGETFTLEVNGLGQWYASCTDPWITVTPATGVGSQVCQVTVDSTLIHGTRQSTISFSSTGQPTQTLTIRQTGYGIIISPDSTAYHIKNSERTREARTMKISLTTNTVFDLSIEFPDGEKKEWLRARDTELEMEQNARPRTMTLYFDWDTNTEPEERKATIVFIPKGTEDIQQKPVAVTIIQHAALKIEDSRAGDSLAIVSICNSLGIFSDLNTSESLDNWENVSVWNRNDEGLPSTEAIGRVRTVRFTLFDCDESIPAEIRYLKYAEYVSFFSNVNSFLKDIELGTEICELKHLKTLELFAVGISSLPDEFAQLGGTLENLNLASNNFNHIPSILTKENFPHLKSLELFANRRWTTIDLRQKDESKFEGGIGLYLHTAKDNALRRLLTWDTLENLSLAYNYMEGELPDFEVGKDGVEAWTQADIDAWGGDTIQWLLGKPKILPKATKVMLNLNFFTGNLPDWLLYHPHLQDWYPERLIFNQQEGGLNSEGKLVHFDNAPSNFEYYYQAFPLFRQKYEINED